MNRFSFSRLTEAWSRLTGRERALLALMGVAVAAMALWLAVMGLTGWRDDARRRFQTAGADHAAVLVASRLAQQHKGAPAALGDGVRQLAEDQGLTLSAVTPAEDGAMTIDIEAGAATAIFAWLANLEARGAVVRAFSAVPGPDGSVQVQVTLAPLA